MNLLVEAQSSNFWMTRFVFQRLLACIYLVGFAVAVNQFVPLCGNHGILPASIFIRRIHFGDSPSIFWFNSSDRFLLSAAWIGLLLSFAAVSGISDAFGIYVSVAIWFALWLLYLSFVNVGQIFYSFGWETLLLEAGFLSIFFGSSDTKVPILVIWLLRWLLFRLMFGAGMIKIRGDSCWRDLTCMMYHYETQPQPNPLSWFFHHLPIPILKTAVGFNHFTELIVPFGYFVRGAIGAAAGCVTIVFQFILIISGNFSWLNWLTIVLCVACLNDHYLQWLPLHRPSELRGLAAHQYAVYGLTVLVSLLSIAPALNLLSTRQLMNTSYDPLHLVNSYGAFGSITKVRQEVIIEGTLDPTGNSGWKEYEFKAKPGDVNRTPPIIAPYHLRLDWLMWFAPFSSCESNPWFVSFLGKLLEGDKPVLGLLRSNPFPERSPNLIRSTLYEYHFTSPEEKHATGAIWKRVPIDSYCPTFERIDSE